jgi:hypothetical protein
MSDVITMLSSEPMTLAEPKQPAHFNVRVGNEIETVVTESCSSVNDVTISVIIGRLLWCQLFSLLGRLNNNANQTFCFSEGYHGCCMIYKFSCVIHM